MPRESKAFALVSDAAVRALADLGGRLREARLKRNWSQAETARKAGLSESSVKKVEGGSVRITIGAYLALLDVFGAPAAFDRVLAPGDDAIGDALSRSQLRRRARQAGSPRPAEWDL
jgi:transcriptional regulator with XRE-family HTH domain